MSDRKPLRRGLSALMADVGVETPDMSSPRRPDQNIPIDLIEANPDQPRRHFAESDLSDLAASIREKGVIQPLVLRPAPDASGRYQIVAGERRWRASQIAGLHELPAVVRELNDTEVLEVAIIENIQRADLNPLEEASGFRQLMDRFGHTQEQLATALGKSRSHIANLLRLLNLPDTLQNHVRQGDLSAGHARALLTADQPEELAKEVIAKGLSVRETERRAKQGPAPVPGEGGAPRAARTPGAGKDADTRALEGDLSATLGMHVTIDHGAAGEGGRVTITYKSLDQLDGLCSLLSHGLQRD